MSAFAINAGIYHDAADLQLTLRSGLSVPLVSIVLTAALLVAQYVSSAYNRKRKFDSEALALPEHNMRVLLTGAFGNVGSSALQEMCRLGYDVTCFDLKSPVSLKKYAEMRKLGLRFRVIWGDLSSKESVSDAVSRVRPEAICHLGAIIPPTAYAIPKISEAVNVYGTRYLMEAAEELPVKPRFVFASSYSVHGSRNGLKDLPLLTGESEPNPMDLYGAQKVRCERMLRDEYEGDFVILRLGAILELSFGMVPRPVFEFAMSHPHQQRRHGCDTRDVGLAFANACRAAQAPGKTLMIGGSDDWKMTAKQCVDGVGKATGMGSFSDDLYRVGDKNDSNSWYFEDHMCTEESQRILQFQRYSYEEYLAEVTRRSRFTRPFAAALSPLIQKYLSRWSPFVEGNRKGEPIRTTQEAWIRRCYPQTPVDHKMPELKPSKAFKAKRQPDSEPEPTN